MPRDASLHRFIESLETSLSVEEVVALRDEDRIAATENMRLHVEMRAAKVEHIISQIPYMNRGSLKNIAEGARIITRALEKRKLVQVLLASTPQGAVQYGVSKEEIAQAFDDISERYDYLHRVVIGMINGRSE